jgi:mannose-1-phosphate guanylyltransferase
MIVPADHAIGDVAAFRATLAQAMDVAVATDRLVTIGIAPTRPETGRLHPGRRAARRRRRTPSRASSRSRIWRGHALLEGGDVLWNGGIFAWRVERILAELRQWTPDVVGPLEHALARYRPGAGSHCPRAVRLDRHGRHGACGAGGRAAPRSRGATSAAAAVADLWRNGHEANSVRGSAILVDSTGCVVDAGSRLVALVGVEDLVVVDTPDALLVCPKGRAQDVRLIVEELRRRKLQRYL